MMHKRERLPSLGLLLFPFLKRTRAAQLLIEAVTLYLCAKNTRKRELHFTCKNKKKETQISALMAYGCAMKN